MIIKDSKILIKAILIDNKFIPIWECTYEDDENYGATYKHKSFGHRDYYDSHFKDVYYDLNTKEITSGTVLEYYPEKDILGPIYKIDDEVYVTDGRKLYKTNITEVIWEVEYNQIGLGQQMKEDYSFYFKDYNWDFNQLYHLKIYQAKYKVKGLNKIIWQHDIHQLEK